ncbi:glycosyltransferase family 9 protein [Seleniivibrio woodruffii]|uniref:glycosyltransferase family 9 protein n=1 Tax=Seleniivibrio woodruffii TaxID=1078050 RepID=UPI0039E2F055
MKFLLIQLYQTGDVVLTTHIPRELKKYYPDAEIDFLVFKANKPVLENNPNIRNILTTERKGGIGEMVRIIKEVRRNRYDAVLDFHNNPRTAYITFLSGAKYKVCYGNSSRRIFYNTPCQNLDGCPGEIKLSLTQPFIKDFDLKRLNAKPEVFTSAQAEKKAGEVLASFGITPSDFLVTISPTHKRDTRRWKFEHFMDTAQHLVREHGAKVLLTYGPGEKEYITDRLTELPENTFLIPQLNLSEFAAVIGRAKLHIGNDSAPHHLATAQNVPTFIVIGSTSSHWVFPSPDHTYANAGLECQPCLKSTCRISPDIPCMTDFGFEHIKEKLERFIKEQKSRL